MDMQDALAAFVVIAFLLLATIGPSFEVIRNGSPHGSSAFATWAPMVTAGLGFGWIIGRTFNSGGFVNFAMLIGGVICGIAALARKLTTATTVFRALITTATLKSGIDEGLPPDHDNATSPPRKAIGGGTARPVNSDDARTVDLPYPL
jgi:hypothetical protein